MWTGLNGCSYNWSWNKLHSSEYQNTWKPETQTHTLSFKHKHTVSYFLLQRSGGFRDPKLPGHYIMSGVTGHCEEERMYAWPLPSSSLDIKLEMPFDLMTSSSSSKKAPSKQNKTFPKSPKNTLSLQHNYEIQEEIQYKMFSLQHLSNINSFNKQDVWHKEYLYINE